MLCIQGGSTSLCRCALELKVLHNPHTQNSDLHFQDTFKSVGHVKHSEPPPEVGGVGSWVRWVWGVRGPREMMTLHQGLRGQSPQVQNRKEGASGALGMLSWGCMGASWEAGEQRRPPSCPQSVQL